MLDGRVRGQSSSRKFIIVTGGVMSGLGKGVTVASIGKLAQLANFNVSCVKIDPYLNVDAGTMNPAIHGEVFVTDDGGESDMDIGTYERFLDKNLTRRHNITTGQIYLNVIKSERKGEFLGNCVQIIPHATDEIKNRLLKLANDTKVDILIVECGGTVGDIESLPFLEALRQLQIDAGASNTLFIHVTLAPYLEKSGEVKTKPTQHSVQELRRIGIQPDIIIVRSTELISQETKKKVSLFTSVEPRCVISNPDTECIYELPEIFASQGLLDSIVERLNLSPGRIDLSQARQLADLFRNLKEKVKVAIVGKYLRHADTYVSVVEALRHAGAAEGVSVTHDWIDAEELEAIHDRLVELDDYAGVLIPGGFGSRGSEGKIAAANYSNEKKIPYLGLCFGFQLAVVAFARYVCELEGANSTELTPNTLHPVIDLLPDQRSIGEKGATMRLGGHDIQIKEGTIAKEIYGTVTIRERHRHRYELNQDYMKQLANHGMTFSAFSDDSKRAEILELKDHPFYMATQYHPEFMSRPYRPEPIFHAFVRAAKARQLQLKA